MAKASRICVGLELIMRTTGDDDKDFEHVNKLVTRLSDFSQQGARGVVMFLSDADTARLLTAVRLGEQVGLIKSQSLVLLSSSEWGDNTDLHPVSSVPIGSLLLKDGQQEVRDFSVHYKLLTPENNTRNPWFSELWEQVSWDWNNKRWS